MRAPSVGGSELLGQIIVYETTFSECGIALRLVWSNHRLPPEKICPAIPIIPARQLVLTCVMLNLAHVQLQG